MTGCCLINFDNDDHFNNHDHGDHCDNGDHDDHDEHDDFVKISFRYRRMFVILLNNSKL